MKKRILAYLLVFTLYLPLCLSFSPHIFAKSLGYKWNTKTVYFQCDFEPQKRAAVSSAMYKWSNVRDTITGETLITMSLTQNNTDNYVVMADSFGMWVGYCDTFHVNGVIRAVTVKLSTESTDVKWHIGKEVGAYDVQSVVLHELGHAVGIAHCHESTEGWGPCWSYTCLNNVMYPFAETNKVKTTLTDYDKASLMLIYDDY